MKLIKETRWTNLLIDAGLEPDKLELVSESKYDPYRRVYQDIKYCYKIVVVGEITSSIRVNNLEQEYRILIKCSDIQGTPKPVRYYQTGTSEVLVIQRLYGETLEKLKSRGVGVWKTMQGLVEINYRLALKGISQNDLQDSNIIVSNSGAICLVDFDQAVVTSRTLAFTRTFLGIKQGGPPVNRSMPDMFLNFLMIKFPGTMKILVKTLQFLAKVKRNTIGRNRIRRKIHKLPTLDKDANDSAKLMLAAWKGAQKSDASSPGKMYAYYSLEFAGYVFPGERSWSERWNVLREITDYSGMRILELGCNMGLLSSYLMKYEGAKESLAVDADKEILVVAELINRALGIKVDHLAINFDSNEGWEDKLINYSPDIVFALNVLNWVNDKERFLQFLGCFNKLIFEGHDSLEVETKRLKSIGYKNISVITRTERNRDVLFCEK